MSYKLEASMKVRLAKRAIEDFSIKNMLSESILCARQQELKVQAKETTPRIVEKTKEQLKYVFTTYSCIHRRQPFKSRPTTGTTPQQM